MDLKKIERLYSSNLEKYGVDSRSVGWNSPESQKIRFEKLMQVVKVDMPFTLNELGCGYGELFRFAELNGMKVDRYNGYDISEKMLAAGKEYIPSDRAHWFKASEIATRADYTVTSGIFNVKFDQQRDRWVSYIEDTLRNMFHFSDKGMAFNLLTTYVDFEADNLFYADPCYFFDFCKKNLSRSVTLYHDYGLFEWTIVVNR